MATRRTPHLLLVASLAVLLGLAGCSSGSSGGSRGDQPTAPGGNTGGGDGGTGNGGNTGDGNGNGNGNGNGDGNGNGNGGNTGGGDDGGGDDGGGTGEPPEPTPTTVDAQPAALLHTEPVSHDLIVARLSGAYWQDADYLEPVRPVSGDTDTRPAGSVRVALTAQGDGFAAWARGSAAYVSRYSRITSQWSDPVAVSATAHAIGEVQLAVDADTGDAFVVWQQSDTSADVLQTVHVNRFVSSTGNWEGEQALSVQMAPAGTAKNLFVSARNGRAAVVWSESDGLPNVCSEADDACKVYLSLYEAGVWNRVTAQDSADKGEYPEVALDRHGNATVIWQRIADDGMQVRARRWIAASGAFDAGSRLLSDIGGDRHPRIGIDGNGNVFVLWRQGGAYVRRFDVTHGWQPSVRLTQSGATFVGGEVGELVVDEAGNAMAVWIEYDGSAASVYARRYNVTSGQWDATEAVENRSFPANTDVIPALALNGSQALIAWMENGPSERDLFAVRNSGSGWSAEQALESRTEPVLAAVAALDAVGNAVVLWVQADGFTASIHHAAYLTAGYVIPAGATWQSLADELYGVDSAEAGAALQAAAGGQATVGRRLSGLPDPLIVETPTTPYYVVQAGGTLSHIAQRVYGTHDVALIEQLREQLGDPALTPGLKLQAPLQLAYFPSTQFSAPLNGSLVATTVTDHHALDTASLVTPRDEWAAAQLMEDSNTAASSPAVAFDDQGRGISVWAQGNDVLVRHYAVATGWSEDVRTIDAQNLRAYEPRLALDRQTGDAVVAWVQNDGTQDSLYVSRYDAGADTWGAVHLVENNDAHPVPTAPEVMSVSISGSNVAVAWLQRSVPAELHAYVARFDGSTWSAVEQLDVSAGVNEPGIAVAIDAAGQVIALWRQGGELWGRHWPAGSAVLDAPRQFDIGGRFPKVAFDAAGRAVAAWERNGAQAAHYDPLTGWATVQSVSSAGALHLELSVGADGSAMVAWVEGNVAANDLRAAVFDVATGTWGAAMLVKDSADPVHNETPIALSFDGEHAVIVWAEQRVQREVNVARFLDGVWTPARAILDNQDAPVSRVSAGVQPSGDASVFWVQPDGAAPSIFSASSVSEPYYLVSAGDTWQMVAAALYGEDSADAGNALQGQMPGVVLAGELRLRGMPATLAVTRTVPQYRLIQAGDTWASITLALYGTNATEAANALRTLLNDPPLTAGDRLEVPDTLAYEVAEI